MNYYDVTPQVIPADSFTEIRITPRFTHKEFPSGPPWLPEVSCKPVNGQLADGVMKAYSWGFETGGIPIEWKLEGRTLVIKGHFPGEQEFNLQVVCKSSENPDYITCTSFKLYSLKPDLMVLRPFKGNTHTHTTGSDGREEPRYVASRYRQKGYDFLAITDHKKYSPSMLAKKYWEGIVPDYNLVPGEEVHCPGNPVHIVNFGGTASINDIYRNNEETYFSQVRNLMKNYGQELPEHVRFAVAASKWAFDNIRRVNGLAILAHPYWRMPRTILPEAIIDALFDAQDFDAFEILGGFQLYQQPENNLQIARYIEEKARGRKTAIVGASDSHCTDKMQFTEDINNVLYNGIEYTITEDGPLFDWYYTIAFATDNSTKALSNAILNLHSVAVDAPDRNMPKIYADFRQVRYASFLLREYFPIHDRLCRDQGNAMLDYLAGEAPALERLKLLQGRLKALQNNFFAG